MGRAWPSGPTPQVQVQGGPTLVPADPTGDPAGSWVGGPLPMAPDLSWLGVSACSQGSGGRAAGAP